MKKIFDVILAHNQVKSEAFLNNLHGKKPLFICAIGTTNTAKIPGISAAGKHPELTDYTPAADVELLLLRECRCIPQVPVTPEGIPTPALITISTLGLADIPIFAVSGGLNVEPQIPLLDLGGETGCDIRTGKAVKNVSEIIDRATVVGENLAKVVDYLVIGESVPGGTTTSLGVMLAMGIDAEGRVSSSMVSNPHELKNQVVQAGMKASGVEFGSLSKDPIEAISCLGDPMMPAFTGLVLGAASKIPVLMAGGTQMGAVLAIVKALDNHVIDNLAIGTTRWIINDRASDLKGIIDQIAEVPILAADLNFSRSKYGGLQAYERGVVKEGVGAGGATVAAMIKSNGAITKEVLLEAIERNYELLVGSN
jgi:uncharacterized protein (TIGR00303 family)